MIHKPKILYNPTNKEIEFMCGGLIHIFAPGEKRPVEGFPAYHALKEVHTGLVEYEGQEESKVGMDYADIPWRQLVSLASKEGIFKPGTGMTKEVLIKELERLDGEEEGAVQEPISQEEV